MSVRILHLADLHLGASFPSLGDRGPERTRDLLSAFLRAVDHATSEARTVDLVAIAGDLFDTHDPDEGLVFQVESALERLHAAHVPALIVPGTHDAISYRRSVYRRLRIPSSAHVFLTPRIEPGPMVEIRGEKVQTYGLAYDPSAPQPSLSDLKLEGAADYRIGLLHGALIDNPAWASRTSDLPIRREEIASCGLHYLALGHYHNFAEIREGRTTAVYPGTLEGRKFGENGPRDLVTATLDRDLVRLERAPWNVRTLSEVLVDLSLSEVSDEVKLEERLQPFAGEREIVRARLEGAVEFVFDAARLEARLKPRFFHIEIDDRSYIVSRTVLHRYRDEPTVRGLFVRRMLDRIENAPDDRTRATAMGALRIGLAEFQNPRHAS